MFKIIDKHNINQLKNNLISMQRYKKDIRNNEIPPHVLFYTEPLYCTGSNIIRKLKYILKDISFNIYSYRDMVGDINTEGVELLEILSRNIDLQDYFDLEDGLEDFDEDDFSMFCDFVADTFQGQIIVIKGNKPFTIEEKIRMRTIYLNEKYKTEDKTTCNFGSIYFHEEKVLIDFSLDDIYSLEDVFISVAKYIVTIVSKQLSKE